MVKRVADRPEAQETNAKLALQPGAVAVGFQAPFDRIADVRRHVLEVREPIRIARHSVAVILDGR